jgi:glycosyltransferase involved in cell wall biosynthesis
MKISFVIPCYNSAKTLRESVESIFNGNFENGDEIIIINDGSTDNTLEIIKKIIKKYEDKIVVINNSDNVGCPASRNIGIKNAKNELIFNLDSDNVLANNSISKLKKELILKNADIVSFGEYFYFKENKNKITHKWICLPGELTLENFLSGHINPGPGGNFLYKKKYLAKYRWLLGIWQRLT